MSVLLSGLLYLECVSSERHCVIGEQAIQERQEVDEQPLPAEHVSHMALDKARILCKSFKTNFLQRRIQCLAIFLSGRETHVQRGFFWGLSQSLNSTKLFTQQFALFLLFEV